MRRASDQKRKYKHTPSKNPRVEVRPPPGELARWMAAAKREGLPLATWIQRVLRGELEPF